MKAKLWISGGKLWISLPGWGELVWMFELSKLPAPPYMGGAICRPPDVFKAVVGKKDILPIASSLQSGGGEIDLSVRLEYTARERFHPHT